MREKGTGNGTIYYSKERKQFVYQYTELDGITGKQLRKTKRFKTMEDAENYRKALNYQKENPLFLIDDAGVFVYNSKMCGKKRWPHPILSSTNLALGGREIICQR